MADIINLRRARKGRDRKEAAQQAEANRARHGLTPMQRKVIDADRARQEKLLDQARRDKEE